MPAILPRGQIHINLPPEHPIMSFGTIEIKMAAVSAKRSIPGGLDRDSNMVTVSQARSQGPLSSFLEEGRERTLGTRLTVSLFGDSNMAAVKSCENQEFFTVVVHNTKIYIY